MLLDNHSTPGQLGLPACCCRQCSHIDAPCMGADIGSMSSTSEGRQVFHEGLAMWTLADSRVYLQGRRTATAGTTSGSHSGLEGHRCAQGHLWSPSQPHVQSCRCTASLPTYMCLARIQAAKIIAGGCAKPFGQATSQRVLKTRYPAEAWANTGAGLYEAADLQDAASPAVPAHFWSFIISAN